jgi:hypothetical protein
VAGQIVVEIQLGQEFLSHWKIPVVILVSGIRADWCVETSVKQQDVRPGESFAVIEREKQVVSCLLSIRDADDSEVFLWTHPRPKVLFVRDDSTGIAEKQVSAERFNVVISRDENDLEGLLGEKAVAKLGSQLFDIRWSVKQVPTDREDICFSVCPNSQYLFEGGKPLVCVGTEVDVCCMNE